jgi:hypothetical protein
MRISALTAAIATRRIIITAVKAIVVRAIAVFVNIEVAIQPQEVKVKYVAEVGLLLKLQDLAMPMQGLY